jgi:hypothetical protein
VDFLVVSEQPIRETVSVLEEPARDQHATPVTDIEELHERGGGYADGGEAEADQNGCWEAQDHPRADGPPEPGNQPTAICRPST